MPCSPVQHRHRVLRCPVVPSFSPRPRIRCGRLPRGPHLASGRQAHPPLSSFRGATPARRSVRRRIARAARLMPFAAHGTPSPRCCCSRQCWRSSSACGSGATRRARSSCPAPRQRSPAWRSSACRHGDRPLPRALRGGPAVERCARAVQSPVRTAPRSARPMQSPVRAVQRRARTQSRVAPIRARVGRKARSAAAHAGASPAHVHARAAQRSARRTGAGTRPPHARLRERRARQGSGRKDAGLRRRRPLARAAASCRRSKALIPDPSPAGGREQSAFSNPVDDPASRSVYPAAAVISDSRTDQR